MEVRPLLGAGVMMLVVAAQIARAEIVRLPSSETALVGRFARGPVDLPLYVNAAEFTATFASGVPGSWPAEVQARQFFANGGSALHVLRLRETGTWTDAFIGSANALSGIHALTPLSNLRILLAPELSLQSSAAFAAGFAEIRGLAQTQGAFFILDPPPGLSSATAMVNWINVAVPDSARFCAVYFPYLQVQLDGMPITVTASGAMAAVFAKSDAAQGIWKSPSGSAFPLQATSTTPALNSADATALNTANVCPIREFAGVGVVPFGARTLHRGSEADRFIPIARTEDWVASSIGRGLAFSAIRDNAEPLWSEVRLQVGGFLHGLWSDGAFQGSTPGEGYFVRCDSTTATAADIAAWRVNVLYGMALLRANEFELSVVTGRTYNPNRAIPKPQLQARSFAGQLHVSYPTEAGFNYVFESAASLLPNDWTAAQPSYGDGAWRRPVLSTQGARGFQRVLITPAR